MILSRRTLSLAIVGVLVAGFVGLMAFALANREPVTGRSGVTRVGKPAADFVLPLLDGG